MKTLRIAVVIYALSPPWAALAADLLPSPASQYGSCALTAPQTEDAKTDKKPGQPPAAPRKPRNKIDINWISDPCNLVDTEHQDEEVRNDGMSPTQRLTLYEDVMEWNRRRAGTDQPQLWWPIAPPSGRADGQLLLGPGPGQALPAVPEPSAYGLWLAGLALLAAAARRRAQRR